MPYSFPLTRFVIAHVAGVSGLLCAGGFALQGNYSAAIPSAIAGLAGFGLNLPPAILQAGQDLASGLAREEAKCEPESPIPGDVSARVKVEGKAGDRFMSSTGPNPILRADWSAEEASRWAAGTVESPGEGDES